MTTEPDSRDLVTLTRLEESLWRTETRFDVEYMDGVLAPDFTEIGRSGHVYDRAATLAAPGQEIDARLPLVNLQIRLLGQDIAQVKYTSYVDYSGDRELAERSSIWRRFAGGWQLVFHQGTPVPSGDA